jgi:hypothetical protein
MDSGIFFEHNSETKAVLSELMGLPSGVQYAAPSEVERILLIWRFQMRLAEEFGDLISDRFAFCMQFIAIVSCTQAIGC